MQKKLYFLLFIVSSLLSADTLEIYKMVSKSMSQKETKGAPIIAKVCVANKPKKIKFIVTDAFVIWKPKTVDNYLKEGSNYCYKVMLKPYRTLSKDSVKVIIDN